MVRKKLVAESVVQRKTIEIVERAQNQIVKLRQEIIETGLGIQAPEIEGVIFSVSKDLLARADVAVKRWSNPRVVERTRNRREHHVALFAAGRERDGGRVRNRASER